MDAFEEQTLNNDDDLEDHFPPGNAQILCKALDKVESGPSRKHDRSWSVNGGLLKPMTMVTRNLGVEQDKIKSAIVKRLFKNATSLKENKQRIVILKTLLLKQTRQPNGYKIMTLIINCIVNKSLRIGLIDMFKRNQLHVLCQEEVDIPQVFG